MAPELPAITAEWLLARVVEQDGCLIWQGECCNDGRDPRGQLNGQRFYVRRAVWKALTGRMPNATWGVATSCTTPRCVDPAHLVHRRRGTTLKGQPKSLMHRARIAATKRAASELPQSAIPEILGSPLSCAEEAKQRGIHKSMVTLIRAGKARRDYSSPFVQLGPR